MALTIQIPAADTLKTLQGVLRWRADAYRILKEREKMVLSGEDYRLLEDLFDNYDASGEEDMSVDSGTDSGYGTEEADDPMSEDSCFVADVDNSR
ncbi:hypothetical protein BJ875DRAFT_480357 [Amylocarpus encephaloides]|uniref:Uncharacterized protein n=1 Tax=Amylocarpus encephaloides TaxID=45428 RepID=A0A9P7YRA9_9HELO|nr:hypothetical protein BJ875DRAFT_480357 [Amylocarpus encephaloides]